MARRSISLAVLAILAWRAYEPGWAKVSVIVDWVVVVVISFLLVAVYFIPTAVRQRKRWAYTPLYFAAIPLDSLNPSIQRYYGDNYLKATEEELPLIRRDMILRTIMSVTIDGALMPVVAGIVLGAIGSARMAAAFILILLTVRLYQIVASLQRIPSYTRGGTALSQGIRLQHAKLVYACFLILFTYIIVTTYNWSRPYFAVGDYSGFGEALLNIAIARIFIPLVVCQFAVAVLVHQMTRPGDQ